MFGGGGGNARRCAPRPSLMLRTGVTALRRPALACGSLVEPGTRLLIHTGLPNKKGRTRRPLHVWWRRRESNPRPRALRPRIYMLIRANLFNRTLPDGQGRRAAIPDEF
jgi:hypothetical protein